MQLVRQAHPFEYRDHHGIDRLGQADLWRSRSGEWAVLVLRGLPATDPEAHGERALRTLDTSLLPYLLRPDVRLNVFVLHQEASGSVKARALVLPLSA
ncbi:hypothetical protein RDMS_10770 [Deinococcus sp. RL]|uniref:hypothetical protein n=1 Tax=Deinococcus sp. RL TaxID=1489678 RepID=UPI0004DA9815|nr:hypothetical protein [Deinococcus sp. RL]KEF33782.1 hypothetical protein RDMS_10770 [Deinococcus sp. RL]